MCLAGGGDKKRRGHVDAVDAERAAVSEAYAPQADPDDGRGHAAAAAARRRPLHRRRGADHHGRPAASRPRGAVPRHGGAEGHRGVQGVLERARRPESAPLPHHVRVGQGGLVRLRSR